MNNILIKNTKNLCHSEINMDAHKLKIQLSLIIGFCFSLLFISSCTLEKEPAIPDASAISSATNEINPTFSIVKIVPISHDSIRAKVILNSKGNLNVIQHGWILSETNEPTIEKHTKKIELGSFPADSFTTFISGLIIGKTYFIRPFLTNGSGTVYGEEQKVQMELPKIEELIIKSDSACFLDLKCNIQSVSPIIQYGAVYQEGIGIPSLQASNQTKGYELNRNAFSVQLHELKTSSTYSIRAYLITQAGVGYGPVQQFITKGERPSVNLNFSINTDSTLFQGAIVKFTNQSVGAHSYQWKFGDNESSNSFSPTHTYNTLGDLNTTLEGKSQGCKFTKEIRLKIINNPFNTPFNDQWVALAGGAFTMGCTSEQSGFCDPDESPAHQVTLSPFEIGKTEITQRQWIAVMGYNASFFSNCGLDCPVELVDYYNIVLNFIPTLNRKTGRVHRLPTEAEWEYAARGGKSFRYAGSNDVSAVGWHNGNSDAKTYRVGLKPPNGYGLYDMTGNVWEWCSDFYSSTYYGRSPTTNPQGPSSSIADLRIRRGGSFATDVVGNARVSYRGQYSHYQANYTIGFRLVRIP